MLPKLTLLIMLVCFCTLMSACSSVGKYNMIGQQTDLKPDYDSAKITINALPEVEIPDDKIIEVKTAIIGRLIASGKVHNISSDDKKANLAIEINITRYRTVSTTAKFMLGMIAGSNQLRANVIVKDGKTGEALRTFEAYGQSSAHPFSSESGYQDALRQFSEQITYGLFGNKS